MKNMKMRSRIIFLCTILVLMAPFTLGGLYIWKQYQFAESMLDSVAPKYGRLLGVELQKDETSELLEQAHTILSKYAYPEDQDVNQAGSAAQQRVRQILSSAGLQVQSTQVIPVKTEKGFDIIAFSVFAEGDQVSLQSALSVLTAQSPPIFVNAAEMRVNIGANPNPYQPPRMSMQFQFSVLRVHS